MSKQVVKRGKGRPASAQAEVGKAGLIRAAEELLREMGPTQVTRQMVANRAGADPALVRYYFGSVENLIAEVAQDINIASRKREAAAATGDPEAALRARIESMLAMFVENPHHHEIMLRYHMGAREGQVKDLWRAGLARSLLELRSIIERGAAAGKWRAVDERMVHLLIVGAMQFLSTSKPLLRDMYGPEVDVEKVRAQFVQFFEDLLFAGMARQPSPK